MAITISGENNNDKILASDGIIDQISGFNIAGIITATTFTGNLIGNVTGNLTGNVNSTSPLLLQTGGSERFRITGNNELGIAGANYGTSGQVLTSGGSGSAVTWSAIPTQITFSNPSNNRILTSEGGVGVNCEANLTWDGNKIHATATGEIARFQSTNSVSTIRLYSTASGHTEIGHTEDTYIAVGGDERLRIKGSNGDVGVGNDSPNCRLAVKDTATHTAYAGSTPSVGDCMLQLYNNPSSEAVNNHSTLQFGVYGGSHNRVNTISAVAENAGNRKMATTFCTDSGSNRNERMRITGDGNVNIGGDYTQTSYVTSITNTANTNLFRVKTANEGDYDLRFNIQNGEAMIWNYGTDDLVFGNRYSRKLHLITNAQKRLTIHGDFVGINTATPNTYLHVKGTGRLLRLETTASGGGQCYIDFNDESAVRASIGMRGSSSDTLTIAALNSGLRFDVQNANSALLINSNGCLQHGTASGVSYFTGSSEYIFGSTTSSPPAGGYESRVQIHGSKTRSVLTIAAYNNNAGGPFMTFLSSRSTTRGTLGSTIGGADTLGDIRFAGDNGTNYNSVALGAQIYATAASTPGSGDTVIAGRLKFVTGTASGGSLPVVMEIREDGHLMLKRGRVNNNGSLLYCEGGYIAGTGTLTFNVPVYSGGNVYKIDMFYSHHSLAYGAYRYGVYGAYSGHSGVQINNDFGSHSSGNGGSWTITRGSAGTDVVITKTAGTYGGQGYWFINVYAGYYTQL